LKDRYFGDIYDYIKYALLRQLTDAAGRATVVCWMLTEDGGGKDGRRTNYLNDPEKWRSFEPAVFDFLHRQVLERKMRRVSAIEKSDVLPNCRFYSRALNDDHAQRERYFDRFLGFAHGSGLVFFDPDNGIEVGSVSYGQRNSSKYLYWSEIDMAVRANHTLLIYQHLPPQPRRPYINRVTSKLLRVCKGGVVYAIRTGKVAFFLVPRRGSILPFRKTVHAVEKRWERVLSISAHRRS